MNQLQTDLVNVIELLIERLENTRHHFHFLDDTPSFPDTVHSGEVSSIISKIVSLGGPPSALSISITIDATQKLRGVLGFAPILYTRQNQQYRNELIGREAIRSVYTIEHSKNSWSKTALILFDRTGDSTSFAACNNAQDVAGLLLNEIPDTVSLYYSSQISADNLLPSYYSGGQEAIDTAFQGTTTKSLREIAEIISGKGARSYDYLDQGIPYLRARDIQNGRIVPAAVHLAPEMAKSFSRQLIQEGDILLTKHFGQRKLALVLEEDLPAIASEALFIIRPFAVSEKYLYRYLTSKTGNAVFNAQLQRIEKGAIVASISLSDLSKIQVPIYDDSTMLEIEQMESLSEAESVAAALRIIRSFGGKTEEALTNQVLNDLAAAGWDTEKFTDQRGQNGGNSNQLADLIYTLPDHSTVFIEIKSNLKRVSPQWSKRISSFLNGTDKCLYILTTGFYYEVHVSGSDKVFKSIYAPSIEELMQWERGLN